MNLTSYRQQSARHVLVYGAPKSGKTAAIAQLARKYRLIYFDLEDSIKTIFNEGLLPAEFRENIDLVKIPDSQLFPMAIETILKVWRNAPVKICWQHGKCSCPSPECKHEYTDVDLSQLSVEKDCVVIESYSQLAESALNYIMRDSLRKDDFDAKAGWDEYGKQGRILERIGSTIQVAPFNVVVSSHEMLVEMNDGTKKIVPIGGTSNVSRIFAKYFDDVVYCDIFNKKHRLVSSTTGKTDVLAGSRTGKILKEGDSLLALFD